MTPHAPSTFAQAVKDLMSSELSEWFSSYESHIGTAMRVMEL